MGKHLIIDQFFKYMPFCFTTLDPINSQDGPRLRSKISPRNYVRLNISINTLRGPYSLYIPGTTFTRPYQKKIGGATAALYLTDIGCYNYIIISLYFVGINNLYVLYYFIVKYNCLAIM